MAFVSDEPMTTSAIPDSTTSNPRIAAGGGTCPRITAASTEAPGTSSSSASDTSIGEVFASRWLKTECPNRCEVSVTVSSSTHCDRRVATERLSRDQAGDQQQQAQEP